MTVTASGPDGTAGSFRILIQAQQPPRLLTAPALAGPATIGAAVGVDPGTWEEAAALALQWCRGGTEIAGATGASYTPVAADDRTALSCRVTASNPAAAPGRDRAAAGHLRRARRRGGARRSRMAARQRRPSVAAAAAFTGAGLSYAVSGAGATIDAATGVVSLPTATLVSAATVTVTASNSGGSAAASFRLSVVAVAPALVTAPQLSGSGKIGAAVGVDAGSWSGKPTPVTALQWRRDGADIAGADRRELHPGGGGRPVRHRVVQRRLQRSNIWLATNRVCHKSRLARSGLVRYLPTTIVGRGVAENAKSERQAS